MGALRCEALASPPSTSGAARLEPWLHRPTKRPAAPHAPSAALVPLARRKRRRLASRAVDCAAARRSAARERRGARSSPRSLQFALSGVSSADTSRALHALRSLPLELQHLSALRSPGDRARCFGWTSRLQLEDAASRDSRVVCAAAKAVEGVSTRRLARRLWTLEDGAVVSTIGAFARVVRCAASRRYARKEDRAQLWVECLARSGRGVCVARKELRQFGGHRVAPVAAAECHALLLRPALVHTGAGLVGGALLQSLRALDPRGEQTAAALRRRVARDLPRLALHWEAALLNDLLPPLALLEQALAAQ